MANTARSSKGGTREDSLKQLTEWLQDKELNAMTHKALQIYSRAQANQRNRGEEKEMGTT